MRKIDDLRWSFFFSEKPPTDAKKFGKLGKPRWRARGKGKKYVKP